MRGNAANWEGCCRAANRLMDLTCFMYHPGNKEARLIAPTAIWAEIIAGELGIETPSEEEDYG